MTDKQPEALRLADALDLGHPLAEEAQQAAALLRTQHEAIERKDALLKRALEALKISAVASKTQREVIDTITKELQ